MGSLVVKPFLATYYNPKVIKNYSLVICPPYDVISKKQLKLLRKKSPYNFSRISVCDNNNYQANALTLTKWVNQGILIDDGQESFYLYEQKFNLQGCSQMRFGLLCLIQMDKKGIFPHEHTLSGPKKDRRRIIKATKANLSPIFIIAAKKLAVFNKLYKLYSRKKTLFSFKDSDNNPSRIWKISDTKQISQLAKAINACKLIIADGHHRFETTYDYFKKNRRRFKNLNYTLAYVTDCQAGLNILPTHRIVTITEGDELFFSKLNKYFNIARVKPHILEKKLNQHRGFCLGISRKSKTYFLSLKDKSVLNKIANKLYWQLNTYLLHQIVLPLFKIKGSVEYTHSLKEARIKAKGQKTAFILRAVSLDKVFKISSKGFRLPQKSTYFYPKVSSGVTIRRFKP